MACIVADYRESRINVHLNHLLSRVVACTVGCLYLEFPHAVCASVTLQSDFPCCGFSFVAEFDSSQSECGTFRTAALCDCDGFACFHLETICSCNGDYQITTTLVPAGGLRRITICNGKFRCIEVEDEIFYFDYFAHVACLVGGAEIEVFACACLNRKALVPVDGICNAGSILEFSYGRPCPACEIRNLCVGRNVLKSLHAGAVFVFPCAVEIVCTLRRIFQIFCKERTCFGNSRT